MEFNINKVFFQINTQYKLELKWIYQDSNSLYKVGKKVPISVTILKT